MNEVSVIDYLENITQSRVNQKVPIGSQGFRVEVPVKKAEAIMSLYNSVNEENRQSLKHYLGKNTCYFRNLSSFAYRVQTRSKQDPFAEKFQ